MKFSISSDTHWLCPVNPAQYDQRSTLTDIEKASLAELAGSLQPFRKFPRRDPPTLHRLLRPLRDVLDWFDTDIRRQHTALRYLIREMHNQQLAFWGWDEAAWMLLLKPSSESTRKDVNHHLMAVAFVLLGVSEFRQALSFRPERFAVKLFGRERVNESVDTVVKHLLDWGFSDQPLQLHVGRALCVMLLKNRSPFLHDLTEEVVNWMYTEGVSESDQDWIPRISRVLAHLGILSHPLIPPNPMQPEAATFEAMTEEWVEWCQRWKRTTTVAGKTRKSVFYQVLKVGRWLYQHHPEIISPADWTRETAVELVAAAQTMCVGDYVSAAADLDPTRIGQPMLPHSKKGLIDAISLYFRDLQAWEWIPIRFEPQRWLAAPRSLKRLIGPSPRVIAEDLWAKLLWAGLNLKDEDLPPSYRQTQHYPLPLMRAVAVMWLFAGLRLNELRRLQVGCIRWQVGDSATDTADPSAVCLLDIPVTKTSTAFTKPVAAVVGEAVGAWEAMRPKQPALVDPKTGERVDFLFAYRGKLIGHNFINHTLVPILCRKAGIPEQDTRGRITSHRARATIASQLANTRQPMSLFELQQWLGHQNPNSTQWYVRVTPTKLTQSYAQAGYFDRNLRTISVLIDQDAIRSGAAINGEPWRYYDLGHGYCTYDFFDQCQHRMACARCSFYVPKDASRLQLLEAQGNLQRMLQEIPLTDDERAAVEDGLTAVEKLQQHLLDRPTPSGLTPRQIQTGSGLIPLETIPIISQTDFNKE
jgi:integrase